MSIRIVFFFVLLFMGAAQLTAQGTELTKAEKKEWKKKAKEYVRNPAALKALIEDRDRYSDEAHRLRAEVNMAKTELDQTAPRMRQLEENNKILNQQLVDAQEALRQVQMENERLRNAATTPTVTQPTTDTYASGVVFRIQVGAFSKGKIPSNIMAYPDVMIEEEGNLQKVLVGNYRDYESAKARVAELKRQGIQGPWIVPFKNGARVSLQEALKN